MRMTQASHLGRSQHSRKNLRPRVLAVIAALAVGQALFPVSRGIAAPAISAQAQWPAPRSGAHAMAFDQRRGLTLLYGDRATDALTLWAWDGHSWRAFTGPGPGLRRHIKMAYDEARDRTVLYGGYDDSGTRINDDTWEWDGRRWNQIQADGPGPRSSYALVYDPTRHAVVLFGGVSPEGAKADTWQWDGKRWTKIADGGPSPRGEAGMMFDSRSRRILLSHGMAYTVRTLANGRTTLALQRDQMPTDTWVLEGRAWRRVSSDNVARMAPIGPAPRTGAALRIGGESDEGKYHGDLWQWSGGAWQVIAGAQIPERHGPAVALDSKRKRLVVFGGFSDGRALADLWEWDGRRWHDVALPR